MTRIIRPLRSGQITIPAEFRKLLGIAEDTMLQMTLAKGELRIKPIETTERAAGTPWLRDLYAQFAPVREETEHHSEEEIDRGIDAAVRAVRGAHG